MKKILLASVMFAAFTIGSNAQIIENFESLKMNIFGAGTNGAISVMANPDPAGINTSGTVGKMLRGWDGESWAGWYAVLDYPVDVTASRYVHVKIWKPRISPVAFKYEGAVMSGNVYPLNPQTLTNQWEELVFDMSICSGLYVKIVLIPDFENPLTLTEDIILYFDELYANNDPTVGSAPVQIMENFEYIPLNLMLNGPDDLSTMTLVPNPDPTGLNLSPWTIEFLRDKDGYTWDGFWSNLPQEIDVTYNKYIHVKVWKPRISILRFKIEGGAAGTIEIPSMYPQTKINEWEDIVFDFSEKTGTYPIIAFLPDFEDPVTLSEDIIIYFDDLVLNNNPNPREPVSQTFQVDMSASGMPPGTQVWISGTMGGIHGTWNEPGTNPNNEMFDPDGDGIYSINMHLPDGFIAFRFFYGNDWSNGDPAPGGDRTIIIEGNMDIFYRWSIDGMIPSIIFNCNMSYQISQGNFDEGTDFLDIAGTFNNWTGENHHLEAVGSGMYTITVQGFTFGEVVEYKFRINGDWNTSEFPNGGPNRTFWVFPDINKITVWYNNEQELLPGDFILTDFEDKTWGMLVPHVMGCGEYDFRDLHVIEETFLIVENPNPGGINTSSKVCKFHRWGTDAGASPWGGVWAYSFPLTDATLNKFVHAKVWKPRISPIRFKLEGGFAGTLEIESMAPQTITNAWEEVCFDFSGLTGAYPIVDFMPDYEDPLTIAEPIDLYFDDIFISDVATFMNKSAQNTFNIYPNPVIDKLIITNFKDVKEIEIFNITGQIVKSFSYTPGVDQVQINMEGLKPGIYFITVNTDNLLHSTKLIKL